MPDRLIAELREWCEAHLPDEWQMTEQRGWLKGWLLRLATLRREQDADWSPPLWLCELTDWQQEMKLSNGAVIEVCGMQVEGRRWSFEELAWCIEHDVDMADLWHAKDTLDLAIDDGKVELRRRRPPPKRPKKKTKTKTYNVNQGDLLR